MQKRRRDIKETRKVSEKQKIFESVWYGSSILVMIGILGLVSLNVLNPIVGFVLIVSVTFLNHFMEHRNLLNPF